MGADVKLSLGRVPRSVPMWFALGMLLSLLAWLRADPQREARRVEIQAGTEP